MTQTRIPQTAKQEVLQIVGSTKFGRYPMVSVEQTFNMYISDEFLVPFAGYKFITEAGLVGQNGRTIYSSTRSGFMYAVIGNGFFQIGTNGFAVLLAGIASSFGDVFITEDTLNNIVFTDKINIYIYNWNLNTFKIATTIGSGIGPTGNGLFFSPNFVTFQDGRIIATGTVASGSVPGSPSNAINGVWALSDPVSQNVNFPNDSQHVGLFQSKADLPIAAIRFPGRGNLLYILGSNISLPWYDQGLTLFPYQIDTTFNIDYGCVNPATIAYLDNKVVWLGRNERTGPIILYTTGYDIQHISTDGIDFVLSHIQFPQQSYGFSFRQDGHLFYIITFYNSADNVTYAYDFNTDKFFTLTDENSNYFVAKRVVYYNNTYYFVSINDGNIYELNSLYLTYQYMTAEQEIPRVRVCPTFRTPDGVPFTTHSIAFPVEQGNDTGVLADQNLEVQNQIASLTIVNGGSGYTHATAIIDGDGIGAHAVLTLLNGVVHSATIDSPGIGYTYAIVTVTGDGTGASIKASISFSNYIPRVDLAISNTGGQTWTSFVGMNMQVEGDRQNRFVYYSLGWGNEITEQFRFSGLGRFVLTNGVRNIYV